LSCPSRADHPRPSEPAQALGCTLFAIAYSYSPFEDPANQGGSINMSAASASYRHPRDSPYSEAFKKLIDSMIVVDPRKRPDIDEVRSVSFGPGLILGLTASHL
jgi:serine/threonine protein kinase